MWDGREEGHPQQPLNDALESIGVGPRPTPGDQVRRMSGLIDLFDGSGLEDIDSRPIEFQLTFKDFDDYWTTQTAVERTRSFPNLTDTEVERLKAALRNSLPTDAGGGIAYPARANAVKGRVPAWPDRRKLARVMGRVFDGV